ILAGAHISNVLGAAGTKYYVIIKSGRGIDPSRKVDGVRDVAITRGRISTIQTNIVGHATKTNDARNKLVVPGLIDIHTHAGRTNDGPALCLEDGVTGLIDAGSQGADNIGQIITVVKSAPQPGRVLINIGRAGILTEGDTMDLKRADVAAAK